MGTAFEEDKVNPDNSVESGKEIKVPPKKLKYLTATAIFLGAITMGCAFTTYGPVATSMQNKYETDDATISAVFSILTGGYLIGALFSGFLYNYVNRQLGVIIVLMIMSAIMFVTPHCPTMTSFFVSVAIMGIAGGAYDAAQMVWLMEMMQKECPPYVMCQHFFYAVGSNLPPLITAPYLDDDKDDPTTPTKTASILLGDQNIPSAVRKGETGSDNKLFIPYIIFGLLLAISALAHTLLFIFLRYYPPPGEINELGEIKLLNKEGENKKIRTLELFGYKIWSFPKFRIVFLTACFFGAHQGMEMCIFNFFPKFGQNSDLSLSESESAYVSTGLSAAYTAGRGVAILAVFKIPGQMLLCGNLVLLLVANVILMIWANNSLAMLWTSSIIFGVGFSSIFPAMCTYIERYLNFTNFIASLMIVCGDGVAVIYPLIVGSFIERNPIVLSYTAFFSLVLEVFALGSLSYITFNDKIRY